MAEPWSTVCRLTSSTSWSRHVCVQMKNPYRTCTTAYVSFLGLSICTHTFEHFFVCPAKNHMALLPVQCELLQEGRSVCWSIEYWPVKQTREAFQWETQLQNCFVLKSPLSFFINSQATQQPFVTALGRAAMSSLKLINQTDHPRHNSFLMEMCVFNTCTKTQIHFVLCVHVKVKAKLELQQYKWTIKSTSKPIT